jgi:hypothetical protein
VIMREGSPERSKRSLRRASGVFGAWGGAVGIHTLVFEMGKNGDMAYLIVAGVFALVAVILFSASVAVRRHAE